MKYAEFVSPPMKVLHQVLNFQEMSVPLFWESVVIAFICNVLPRGFLRDKPVPCVDRIGNLELMQLRADDHKCGMYLVGRKKERSNFYCTLVYSTYISIMNWH